jgi:type IV secretion system protein VirB9
MSDGRRTFIVFPPGLAQVEAPALFAISPEGAPELVNYRLAGDVLVVDQVLERAELRAPGAKRGAVQISRLGARS